MGRVEKNLSRSTRSRPVSCLFCRSRKLRCSRQFPCPNCTSRGLACQLGGPAPSSAGSIEGSPEAPPDTFRQDVLERLRRLEEIVAEKRKPPNIVDEQTSQEQPLRPWQKGNPPSASVKGPQDSDIDVDWLEGEVTYSIPTDSLVAYDIEFKTCSIKKAAHAASVFEKRHNSAVATRCVWLPFHDEAKEIVNKYLTDITYIHHVVHIPSVKSSVDDLYRGLSTGDPGSIKLGHVALLLAILASTTFFWTELDMNSPLFSSVAEANEQAALWLKISLDVLEYSRRKALDSLEDVQAMIIVGFMVTNLVGVASQAWYVFSNAIAVARRLSLHRIDHPRHGTIDGSHPGSIQAEIGRRVWWYLVATDWQFSQYAGPQKGTYSINPKHMATKKPLNANDEDLVDGATYVNKPMDRPTSMSYSLQRIQLAELCREVTDRIPFAESCYETSNYQHIRDVDAQICKIINEMPSFFSLDNSSEKVASDNPQTPPGIIIQRYVINSLLHAQRCRLHLPYLSRAAVESEDDFSREACLQAARMVIRMERLLATERIPFVIARLRFSGVLHCVCMAIIVLLMDVCLNKSIRPEDDQQRRAEIYNAFSVLEEAKGQSPFAEKILESFYAVLWRHKAPIPGVSGKTVVRAENDGEHPPSESITDSTTSINIPIECNENGPWDPTLPTFDDLWQQFDNSVDPSASFDWTSLFAELDAPFVSISR
ncbi:uncharacterized protein N7483_009296 [Penicillium malachiteum]|uniref:uncharacterized protein n=1 Tax=Penicillium malachiteum TaxID=1324776 RepID=UPI002546ADDA|nr:uncharacterized protein N7483_009296 [Penicillium malachiteum]KAJ5721362.1 hypothetical protein N7483_009296 [Penicillium malachiteum]